MPEPEPQTYLGVSAIIASPAMLQVMALVERAARTSAALLITGETGTGKEIVARAVHHYSLRAGRPWVDVNCAALPEHLMESELFGHERGAFSGAESARPGLFEMADTGTLFLDEIGELETRMQVKLLRVLDGVPYFRVGGRKKVAVDARVVAATNQELEAAVAAGRFRRDLYHRLTQCVIRVPPLRERREDLVPLCEHFLRQYSDQATLSAGAREAVTRYQWPGNVRELRNVMTSAAINATSREIQAEDLRFRNPAPAAPEPVGFGAAGLRLDGLEREAILAALRKTGGHQQRTADLLGISRRTLIRKLKLYPARPEDTPAHVT